MAGVKTPAIQERRFYGMKIKITCVLMMFLVLAVSTAIPVLAQSATLLPHAFYGSVSFNGQSAPAGTVIEARVIKNGIDIATHEDGCGNPIVTTKAGEYGSTLGTEEWFLVQPKPDTDLQDGDIIQFYVNGVKAEQTYMFQSDTTTKLNLTANGIAAISTTESTQSSTSGDTGSVTISSTGSNQESSSDTTTNTSNNNDSSTPDNSANVQDQSNAVDGNSNAINQQNNQVKNNNNIFITVLIAVGIILVAAIIIVLIRRRSSY